MLYKDLLKYTVTTFLVIVLLPLEATAFGVSLELNRETFTPGAVMEVTAGVSKPGSIAPVKADVYLAVVTPDSIIYCLKGDCSMGGPNELSPLIENWAVKEAPPLTLLAFELPAGTPMGPYTWYLVLCRPGTNMGETANWLASAMSSLTVAKPVILVDDDKELESIVHKDPAKIDSVEVSGDLLKIKVTYTGGCVKHDFELIRPSVIGFAPNGPQDLILSHDSKSDGCNEVITQELLFDISSFDNFWDLSQSMPLLLWIWAPGSEENFEPAPYWGN